MLDKLFLLNRVANIRTPFLGSISWICKVHEEDEGFRKESVEEREWVGIKLLS